MGKALGNLKNIGEANLGDLSGGEKAQRGLMGGLGGGLHSLSTRQQPQPGAGAPPIGIAPGPTYDFSQIGMQQKKSPFYGGY